MTKDEQILRPLAYEYAAAAREARNAERRQLHIASNDLHMIRPVVMIDEIPWLQMNFDNSLDCCCEDGDLRGVEFWMRRQLYQYKHFPVDMFLQDYVGVGKIVRSTGIGIEANDHAIPTGQATHIMAHEYEDLLKDESDIEKIRLPVLTYDEEATLCEWTKIGTAIGDILPVRITGASSCGIASWDDITRYRGVESLLTDLALRPEFSHAVIEKITQCKVAEFNQREEMGLLDNDPHTLHCTPALTEDLPAPDGGKVTRKNIWGRGTAQIFGSVSREMHDEFDIEYMKRTVGTCGLLYYGCCEPLHNKVDIVEKLPNLRKIGITPWADVNVAAEVIGGRYVVSNKPNPASVAVPMLDEGALRAEIGEILDACKRNSVKGLDITLKDISTCNGRPENIFRWAEIVMEMALNW
ncbi:MAG: hypothetical protein FWF08_01825 [Oscillospiraceae bacterium]|nr:hypothetical protein [Oscillospiraceae bacterium]